MVGSGWQWNAGTSFIPNRGGKKEALQNLERQGYRCFLPLANATRIRRDKRYQSADAFFPRYLFVRLDLETAIFSPVRSTRGVTELVRFGTGFPPAPRVMVDELLARVGDDRLVVREAPLFR